MNVTNVGCHYFLLQVPLEYSPFSLNSDVQIPNCIISVKLYYSSLLMA